MTDRSAKSQSFHNKLIKQLAESLIARKFVDVRADHPDFSEKPSCIALDATRRSQTPDVTATGIRMVLFEVETNDSINDMHTEEQWKLFASYADRHNGEFWVVVPKTEKKAAWERVASLGLKAKVMGI